MAETSGKHMAESSKVQEKFNEELFPTWPVLFCFCLLFIKKARNQIVRCQTEFDEDNSGPSFY